MIILNIDLDAGTAKLAQNTTVKYGADVPVQIIFATTPGTVTGMELALGADSSTPTLLAYTDVFTPENDTTWAGSVSTLTTQLATALNAKEVIAVIAELTVIVDGKTLILPNVSLSVQQLINNGAAAVTAGQSYYTKTEIDGMLATFALLTKAGKYRFTSDGTFELWNATQNKWQILTATGAAGAETTTNTIDNS